MRYCAERWSSSWEEREEGVKGERGREREEGQAKGEKGRREEGGGRKDE